MKHLKIVVLDTKAVGEIIEVPDALEEDNLDIFCWFPCYRNPYECC